MPTLYFLALVLAFTSMAYAQTTANDGDWKANTVVLKNTAEADVMIRLGDIDNLGFGFPADFDVFTGRSTPPHAYPWQPAKNDVPGMDRILIGSGYGKKSQPCGGDGYTGSNPSRPVPYQLALDAVKGVGISGALLTMFVDDFQKSLCPTYQAYINGKRFNDLENVLNSLEQGGPIGKFISVRFPAELLPTLQSPKLSILINDSTSGAADGFAIDFIKLLVNPKPLLYTNSISGFVRRRDTDEPLANALVVVRGFGETRTNEEGKFTMSNLPVGLTVVEASYAGFQSNSAVFDIIAGEPGNEETIYLEQTKDLLFGGRKLAVGDTLTLNNIQFKVASAELNTEAKSELDKVVSLMSQNPRVEIELSGHTSSEGSAENNTTLSQQRVQSCKAYLISKGIDEGRIYAVGYGPKRPIADNNSEQGRIQNRRVEMRIVKL